MSAGFFITEKETEAYLVSETRDLPMPGGTLKPHTDFKLTWRIYDLLAEYSGFTKEELVAEAVRTRDLTGRSFEESFTAVLSSIYDQWVAS